MMKQKSVMVNLFDREQAIVANVQSMYGLKSSQAIRYILNDWARQQPQQLQQPQQPQQNQLSLIPDLNPD